MDILSFISSLVASVAWPFTVVVVILIFRNSIGKLISSMAKFKYKDLEAEFHSIEIKADAIPEITERKEALPKYEQVVYSSLIEQIKDIAPRSPEGAIFISWTAVEAALSAVVNRLAISPDAPSSRSVTHNLNCLREYTKADLNITSTINDMRVLRNKIAHGDMGMYKISVEQALDYGRISEKIIGALQRLKRE